MTLLRRKDLGQENIGPCSTLGANEKAQSLGKLGQYSLIQSSALVDFLRFSFFCSVCLLVRRTDQPSVC